MMIVFVYREIKNNGRRETNISKVSQLPAGPRIRAAQRPEILVLTKSYIVNAFGQEKNKNFLYDYLQTT